MKNTFRLLLSGLLSIGTGAALLAKTETPAPAAGPVQVMFEHPEKYTDLRDGSSDFDNDNGRGRYLPLIKEHVEKEAARRLPAGQQLTVTFTDIDLAGDYEPWRGFQYNDVRIVKDIYIPRITLTFKLTDASGAVLKEGERKLSDTAFQMSAVSGFSDDALRYEKQMLTDWLRREFMPIKG